MEKEKANRRRRKYAKTNDDSLSARRAYSCHDEGESPQDVSDDVPPEHLEKLKNNYCETHIAVDRQKMDEIELFTRNQSSAMNTNAQQLWFNERRKRITASRIGGITKMRNKTKTANKVKEMLYSKFRGNAHTLYGVINENTSRNEYITDMHNHGYTGLTVSLSGLTISKTIILDSSKS